MLRSVLLSLLACALAAAPARAATPPPANAGFDYQIGGDYALPAGVGVVSRDWFIGAAPEGAYAICYVNAFQTQDDEPGVSRRDERSAWPRSLVLTELGDDPNWGGEYLVDISTARKRKRAANWIQPMIRTCKRKGFEAVEYDNLDSWTRFDDTPREGDVPFGKARRDRLREAPGAARPPARAGRRPEEHGRADPPAGAATDPLRLRHRRGVRALRRVRRLPRGSTATASIAIEYRRQDFDAACRAVGRVRRGRPARPQRDAPGLRQLRLRRLLRDRVVADHPPVRVDGGADRAQPGVVRVGVERATCRSGCSTKLR